MRPHISPLPQARWNCPPGTMLSATAQLPSNAEHPLNCWFALMVQVVYPVSAPVNVTRGMDQMKPQRTSSSGLADLNATVTLTSSIQKVSGRIPAIQMVRARFSLPVKAFQHILGSSSITLPICYLSPQSALIVTRHLLANNTHRRNHDPNIQGKRMIYL